MASCRVQDLERQEKHGGSSKTSRGDRGRCSQRKGAFKPKALKVHLKNPEAWIFSGSLDFIKM